MNNSSPSKKLQEETKEHSTIKMQYVESTRKRKRSQSNANNKNATKKRKLNDSGAAIVGSSPNTAT